MFCSITPVTENAIVGALETAAELIGGGMQEKARTTMQEKASEPRCKKKQEHRCKNKAFYPTAEPIKVLERRNDITSQREPKRAREQQRERELERVRESLRDPERPREIHRN